MRVRILGSAARGHPGTSGDGDTEPRTRDTVAVSADGGTWFLLNVSPDILRQLAVARSLKARDGRAGAIAGVVLTSSDLDHRFGLSLLCERCCVRLYATQRVRAGLFDDNVVLRALGDEAQRLRFDAIALLEESPLLREDGRDSGLRVCAFAVPGELPTHLRGLVAPDPEHNVALVIRDAATGARVVYAPQSADTESVARHGGGADILLFDGTIWSADDQLRSHVPVGGPHGSLARLAGVGARRRILTHLAHTNPIARRRTRERIEVESRGWSVARDGWELGT